MQKPMDRLKRKVEKENLWVFILAALKKKNRCGSELRKLIEERFGFLIGTMTAYKILYLLEMGNYARPKRAGKAVYYKITKKGLAELGSAKKYFKECMKGI